MRLATRWRRGSATDRRRGNPPVPGFLVNTATHEVPQAARALAFSLALACHPVPTAAMTVAVTVAAALSGRSGPRVPAGRRGGAHRAAHDRLDQRRGRPRPRPPGRPPDKPVAMGWVDPGTVTFAVAVRGPAGHPAVAGQRHRRRPRAPRRGAQPPGCTTSTSSRRCSPGCRTPSSFGLLPAFLSYGGLGGGLHGGPPTLAMTVLAALLGVGVHFLTALPDLVEDNETGVRHLPLRIALRIGAPRLLWISTRVHRAGAGRDPRSPP